jgi:starch synthase
MRVLIAASEANPYAKTGGLADVTGALLNEFRKKDYNVSLCLPLYRTIRESCRLFPTGKSFSLVMGTRTLSADVWTSGEEPTPRAYFIRCDALFDREELYGTPDGDYGDNAIRFAFFSRAVLEMCIALKLRPDVIHCNDWQTGLLPLYLKDTYREEKLLRKTAVLFTVHNLGYQGLFPAHELINTGLGWQYFTPSGIEFYGSISFMKAGLLYGDILNTVSVTHAQEILGEEHGFGLEGVLKIRQEDLYGILNGVDYAEWDPAADGLIPAGYTKENLSGKKACRKELLKRVGLRNHKSPLFGMVSRLSSQKGLDLIAASVDEIVSLGANLIFLGRGDEYYQALLADIAGRHKESVFIKVGFEEPLAHLIYAGCDFFLMPSKYEPCGLGQLIALRYGTVPVARRTGGLADTIEDFNHLAGRGTGFLFDDYTTSAFQDAVKRALCVFVNDRGLAKIRYNSMKADFSWELSARRYAELYRRAAAKAVR